jgi:hypothetical protein
MEAEELEAWLAEIARLDLAQPGRALSTLSDIESVGVQAVEVSLADLKRERDA